MTDEGTPIGPGFFIFFQHESGGIGKKKVIFHEDSNDDDEALQLTKLLFTFIHEQDS